MAKNKAKHLKLRKITRLRKAFLMLPVLIISTAFLAVVAASMYHASLPKGWTPPPSQREKPELVANPAASSTPSPTPTPPVPHAPYVPPQACPPGSPFIVITQWGVKFPACGDIADIQYEIVGGNVVFYSPELYPKYPYCSPAGNGEGALVRQPAATSQPNDDMINAGVINGWRYYFGGEQEPCVQYVPVDSPDALRDENIDNALTIEMRNYLTASP
jgi:hypothetical protein